MPNSTAPKKSSPLAGPPVTVDDDDDERPTPPAQRRRVAAPASSGPPPKPAPDPASGQQPGMNPRRNNGMTFTLIPSSPASVPPPPPPPPTKEPVEQPSAQLPVAPTFAPPTPSLAPTPTTGWSQPLTNRGHKRQAEEELYRDRTSPGMETEPTLFLLENVTAYPRPYMTDRYLDMAKYRQDDWNALMGLFFTQSGENPLDVLWGSIGVQKWIRNFARIDQIEKEPGSLPVWNLPERMKEEDLVRGLSGSGHRKLIECFKEAMKLFAKTDDLGEKSRLRTILEVAGWCQGAWGSPEWMKMAELKTLPEGPEREAQLARARSELPRFCEHYYNDRSCGSQIITRPRPEPYDSESYPPTETYTISYDNQGRHEVYDTSHDQKYRERLATEHASKRRMMAFGGGRPTQIHAVPYEERALDSHGRKLPWAHEWPEGHPNARGHRRQPEEKGPFGKSSVRKSSSRASRTATPAKKDHPALDGFEQAMKHDQKKKQAAEAQQQSSTTKAQSESTSIPRQPSFTKEPTQVILFGFSSSDRRCEAIDKYETFSCGMICEDYPRKLRPKYPTAFSPASTRRALTPAEKLLVNKFAGGNHWVKVTFDSAEAAERAIYCSPHEIGGHWVYAQEYRGVGPDVDEPILIRRDDQGSQLLGAASRPSQTIGPSFGQKSNIGSSGATTLPRSFAPDVMPQTSEQEPTGIASLSSSTASSATATGPSNSDLRNRHISQTEENRSSTTSQPNGQATTRPQGFTHFPDIPRTVLRPASEAFLPHPSWSESILQRLINAGWIPSDFIGNGAPRLENGDFDYANASYYWIICHWLDSKLGTDLCGLQDQ